MCHHRNNLNLYSSTRCQNNSSDLRHHPGNNINPRRLRHNEEYVELEGQIQADHDG